MTPRWYRTRWFWGGLIVLCLLIAAWAGSFAGGKGRAWGYRDSRRHYFVSQGGGRIGAGFGESMAVRYPSLSSMNGWSNSPWELKHADPAVRFPTIQFEITDGKATLWTRYSVWITVWLIAWLVPIVCRSLPRRARPPRFPGTPRPWFTSPFLWAGIPGFVILVTLWIDSSSHRSLVNWKWTRGFKVQPNYLGFGIESNRGQAAIWTGRPFEGLFFRKTKPGLFAERTKSTGDFFFPDAKQRKGTRRLQASYLALTSSYLILWASMAALWQYRQSRLPRPQLPPA